MSIDSGPKADRAPSSSTSRPCERRRGERDIAGDDRDASPPVIERFTDS
jgi:hypothetical protein